MRLGSTNNNRALNLNSRGWSVVGYVEPRIKYCQTVGKRSNVVFAENDVLIGNWRFDTLFGCGRAWCRCVGVIFVVVINVIFLFILKINNFRNISRLPVVRTRRHSIVTHIRTYPLTVTVPTR